MGTLNRSTFDELRDSQRNAAVLAIAPIVLGLTETGKRALAAEGTMYMSDAELQKMYAIVHAVERALKG